MRRKRKFVERRRMNNKRTALLEQLSYNGRVLRDEQAAETNSIVRTGGLKRGLPRKRFINSSVQWGGEPIVDLNIYVNRCSRESFTNFFFLSSSLRSTHVRWFFKHYLVTLPVGGGMFSHGGGGGRGIRRVNDRSAVRKKYRDSFG